jgi:hypothetical protein
MSKYAFKGRVSFIAKLETNVSIKKWAEEAFSKGQRNRERLEMKMKME